MHGEWVTTLASSDKTMVEQLVSVQYGRYRSDIMQSVG